MTQLLDHLGRPVKTAVLDKEVAAPRMGTARQVWNASSVASGLTPERLGRILRAATAGDLVSYLQLAEEMEEREPHYASVLGTRKRAVLGIVPTVEAASDSEDDLRIAAEVRRLVEAPEFEDLCADLLDALGKGYSITEIMWNRKATPWRPRAYEHRDPSWFRFDQESGRVPLLIDNDAPMGRELEPFKFAVHYPKLKTGVPARGGLARLAAWSYIFKNYATKDWMAFAETFGMPIRLGTYNASATEEDRNELFKAVANIGTDNAAVIPEGMKIEFEEAASGKGGENLFERLADWTDRQISKAVIGQTMTTDEGGRGGRAQAQVHDEVRSDIRDYDARQLAKTLNRDLVRVFVDLNYGVRAEYPRLKLDVDEGEEFGAWLEGVWQFVDRGGKVKMSEVRDRLRLEAPADDDEVLRPRSNAAPDDEQDAGAPVRRADAPREETRQALNRAETSQDLVDELAGEEAGRWREVMDPALQPVMDAIEAAESYEQAIAAIEQLPGEMDMGPLARRLAGMMFKARGAGDAGQ